MKRKIFCFLLTIAAMLTIFANTAFSEAQLYYVTDDANLLSEDEDIKLEEMAKTVSNKYSVGVYIVTLEDYQDFSFDDVYTAAYEIYHEYKMGEGENRDGIMLLISMKERDYAMFCYGERCEYAFNDYGQEMLEEVFLDNFKEDDWYGGFEDYIEECSIYLEKAEEGRPVRESPAFYIFVVTAIALFIALLVLGFAWMRMKSVAEKTMANAYISGELHLTEKTDTFTHRTELRRKIERNSSSRGRSHSGGGGSGRSGKF